MFTIKKWNKERSLLRNEFKNLNSPRIAYHEMFYFQNKNSKILKLETGYSERSTRPFSILKNSVGKVLDQ